MYFRREYESGGLAAVFSREPAKKLPDPVHRTVNPFQRNSGRDSGENGAVNGIGFGQSAFGAIALVA